MAKVKTRDEERERWREESRQLRLHMGQNQAKLKEAELAFNQYNLMIDLAEKSYEIKGEKTPK